MRKLNCNVTCDATPSSSSGRRIRLSLSDSFSFEQFRSVEFLEEDREEFAKTLALVVMIGAFNDKSAICCIHFSCDKVSESKLVEMAMSGYSHGLEEIVVELDVHHRQAGLKKRPVARGSMLILACVICLQVQLNYFLEEQMFNAFIAGPRRIIELVEKYGCKNWFFYCQVFTWSHGQAMPGKIRIKSVLSASALCKRWLLMMLHMVLFVAVCVVGVAEGNRSCSPGLDSVGRFS
ncbi:hypothetical protein LguiA_015600 [Lonicera macranthoides]